MSKKHDEQQVSLSRREFLKKSALVTAVTLPVAGALLQAKGAGAAQPAAAPAAAPVADPVVLSPARSGMKYLFVDRKHCTGCALCERACSIHHEKGVYRPALSRIHVVRHKSIVEIPMICWHCEDAPCVEACPVTPKKAIAKNKETNIIAFTDENLCLGATCNLCIEACPARYLRRHPDTARPLFCDLCGGDPRCVRACEKMAGNDLTPALTTKRSGGGVNIAYREVNPDEAAEGLILDMYYPNPSNGGRI